MNRLTKKVSKIEAMLDYGSEYIPSENCHSEFELYYKLGKLEDIEEELGIDLITLFEALIEGIYYIDTNSYFQPDLFYDGEMNLDDENDNFFFKITYYDDVLETKVIDILSVKNDYKKTWALTREELEE